MKKLLILSFLMIIILAAVMDFTYHSLPAMASKYLTEKADVSVELKRVTFQSDRIRMYDFSMNNPKNDILQHAMTVKTIEMQTPYSNYLFKNPMLIDHLSLHDVYVSLELSKDNSTACNWNIITNNMNKNSVHWYSKERKAFIKKLSFYNITVVIKLYGKPVQTLPLIDRIEFANVDVQNGIPTKEISKIIVNKMLYSLISLESIKAILTFPLGSFKMFSKHHNKNEDPCADYNKHLQSK